MTIAITPELRKIDGQRFARFTLRSPIPADSKPQIQLVAALRECNIEPGKYVGLFKTAAPADDVEGAYIGGVDIPITAIEAFTNCISEKGFKVS